MRTYSQQQNSWREVYLSVTSYAVIGVSVKMADCSILMFYFIENLNNLNILNKTKPIFYIYLT